MVNTGLIKNLNVVCFALSRSLHQVQEEFLFDAQVVEYAACIPKEVSRKMYRMACSMVASVFMAHRSQNHTRFHT